MDGIPLHIPRKVGLLLATLLIGLGAGLAGSAVLVAAQPPESYSHAASVAEADKLLGRATPQIRRLPAGLRLAQVAIDSVGNGNRGVILSYALDGTPVATMTILRVPEIRNTDPHETMTRNGTAYAVSSKDLPNRSTVLTYTWSKDSLSFVLHVVVVNGLTRDIADSLVMSVE